MNNHLEVLRFFFMIKIIQYHFLTINMIVTNTNMSVILFLLYIFQDCILSLRNNEIILM